MMYGFEEENNYDVKDFLLFYFLFQLGLHPTLEEMQDNVVTKKLRPKIESIWRTQSVSEFIMHIIKDLNLDPTLDSILKTKIAEIQIFWVCFLI